MTRNKSTLITEIKEYLEKEGLDLPTAKRLADGCVVIFLQGRLPVAEQERERKFKERLELISHYERNIAPAVPATLDDIDAALSKYAAAVIHDAIDTAVRNNVRKWVYIVGVLEKNNSGARPGTPKKVYFAEDD